MPATILQWKLLSSTWFGASKAHLPKSPSSLEELFFFTGRERERERERERQRQREKERLCVISRGRLVFGARRELPEPEELRGGSAVYAYVYVYVYAYVYVYVI